MVKLTEKLCKELGGMWYDHHEKYWDNVCVGINLEGANLPEAKLWRANLTNASFINANLSNADLDGARFNKTTIKSLLF